jgi:plasmid stability protein
MKRMQLYLPEDTYEELRRQAYEERKSIAGVIREALAQYLVGDQQRERPAEAITERELTAEELQKNPLYQIIGLYSSDTPDASVHHDDYLYERGRR